MSAIKIAQTDHGTFLLQTDFSEDELQQARKFDSLSDAMSAAIDMLGGAQTDDQQAMDEQFNEGFMSARGIRL